jgi:O-antigen/teichoic acid export membrane protein
MNFRKYVEFFLSLFKNRGSRTKSVIRGSISVLGSTMIGNLSRLGLVMILSRYYSKEEFGIWATITATASVIAFSDFGIINALRNKISQLIVMGEDGLQEARKYFFSSFIFFIFISLIISSLVAVLSRFISFDSLFKTDNQMLKGQGVFILLWIQFLFFLNIPLSMGVVSFFSFQESKFNAFFSLAQALSSFVIVVLLTILKSSIVTISIGYFISSTLVSGVGTLYFLKRRRWFTYSFKVNEFFSQIKELLSTGIKFMGLQLSNSFLQNAGTILASSFLGLNIAAEFNMVQKLYAFFTGIYQSIFNPVWGGYAEAAAKNDWKWCKNALNVTLIVSAVLFSAAIGFLYFFGNYFLLIIAGKGYITQQILFIVLGLTYLFVILFSTATILQNATNRLNLLLVVLLTASVLIFPISKFLMKGYGIIGIALSSSLIWIVLTIIMSFQTYYILRKNLKLQNTSLRYETS